MPNSDTKEMVKERYGNVAKQATETGCCGEESVEEIAPSSCCGGSAKEATSKSIGYTDEELSSIPTEANLGVGCGNPLALASVKEGDTVVDLGSGGGIDCFLASKRVGESGKVIGVDMTPAMLDKARLNAEKGGYTNVEFREGDIESLPIDAGTVDVVISNCVINLSTEKEKVFAEVFRVLKPGGQFFISDIVLNKALPPAIAKSAAAHTACVGGGVLRDVYLGMIDTAGFTNVEIMHEANFPIEMYAADPTLSDIREGIEDLSPDDIQAAMESVVSIKITGMKPEAVTGKGCC
ncbi:MAG: arsenite S-adenosylmethyltransferase [Candidatus Hydrogenedentota bacterium]|nr:MAG: arsenite S-adenosylmethyltransferase [Candidatus Hydrogenedentota bacterium]